MAKKAKKQKQVRKKHRSRTVIIVLIVLCVIGALMSGSNDSSDDDEPETQVATETESETDAKVETETEAETVTETEAEESHIYDDAEIVDVMNGSKTEKVGEVSIIYAESDSITEDVLNDWYFNYVAENDYNYCLIVYTDIENTGCYAVNAMVETDVMLKSDGELYSVADDSAAQMYLPENNELVEYGGPETESETDAAVAQTQAETMVWISSSGTKYHKKSTCSGMTDAWQVTLSEATAMGRTACSKCY